MIIYISMLRGINVAGQKKVRMDELKKLYESLGFKAVQTYIQSGNVIFQFPNTNISKLQNMIERKIKGSLKLDVHVLIRTKNEFQILIENTPFQKKDITKLHITFLSDVPVHVPLDEINKTKGKSEEFSISDREIYLFYPDGYGKSKLSNNFFERKLKTSATTRNWKTITALFDIAKSI